MEKNWYKKITDNVYGIQMYHININQYQNWVEQYIVWHSAPRVEETMHDCQFKH